jgi:hypothetical protein
MAIVNGKIRGFRPAVKNQKSSGALVIMGAFFNEDFAGEFADLISAPLFIEYELTEDGEPLSSLYGICTVDGGQAGELHRYYRNPGTLPAPCRVSSTISNISGWPIFGISYKVGPVPVTVDVPPCGPRPWVFFDDKPPASNPFNPNGQSGWVGNTFSHRG